MKNQINCLLILCFCLVGGSLVGQDKKQTKSLKQCIAYAYEHNLALKRTQMSLKLSENNLKQAKYNRLPSLSASSSWSNGYGRSIDYVTNGYTNQHSSNVSYGLGTSVSLFNGFRKKHQIEKNKLDLQAELSNIEVLKENLALQIASFYLSVLYASEQLEIVKEDLKIAEKQKERTAELVKSGKLPKGNLLEQLSVIARKKTALVESENRLNLAYLDLYQALDIKKGEEFLVEIPSEKQMENASFLLGNYSEKLEGIVLKRPMLKVLEYRKKSAKKNLQIAKSGYYPSLNFSASIGSGFSNLRYEYSLDALTKELVKVGRMSFADQYNLNLSKSWGLSLSIPLFQNFQNKTATSNAALQLEDLQIQEQIEKNRLEKELQQAYANAIGAVKKYQATSKTVKAMEESFRYSEEKYQLGLLSNFDYNEALANLSSAKSAMLQAKYEYVFKTKILEFYAGGEF